MDRKRRSTPVPGSTSVTDESRKYRVAYQLWTLYYDHVVKYIPDLAHQRKTTVDENKYRKQFFKIAEMCLANGVDPQDYFEITLAGISKDIKYLYPSDFSRAAHMQAYLKIRQDSGSNCHQEWNTLCTILKTTAAATIPERYEFINEILMDIAQPFPAWFRITFNTDWVKPLVEFYGPHAREELMSNLTMLKYLRKIRPQHIDLLERLFGAFGVPQ